ncbi:hypothetical protein [Synechocystis salina]|uniref:Uncharacterized protein n=1 Tax=Synechocystis salina LEGE 00031 TaxID=1828736 RepID=A0ABR9VVT2_9SYNC|nr:hypothetical protein [Synechocystis salina]MBE9242346.1 hypothetical protein [Synechocystis salina LEGE 00041]MBE9255460.1 hypothetical protein [Synechocystis salina LEGE 00031]
MFNLALYYYVEIKTPENIRVILALADHQPNPTPYLFRLRQSQGHSPLLLAQTLTLLAIAFRILKG